ncbi:MAG: DUF3307 domain-containing protein [Paludibacteraceae bacterium]|nr:DUF3307 domain-containing protein [Paludibacteraceae bacterium]
MNTIVLLELLLAHIAADFLFQTRRMVEKKKCGKFFGCLRSVCSHSFIHAFTAYIFVHDFQNWFIPIVVFISHLIIDVIKYYPYKGSFTAFIIDQILHVVVIVCVWILKYCPAFDICSAFAEFERCITNELLLKALAFVVVWKPTSIIISYFIAKWAPEVAENQLNSSEQSGKIIYTDKKEIHINKWNGLKYAGEWIGYFERSLIIVFIFTNNFGGVGFLLAAKSVFRYGELRRKDEVSITEYVLLGTLASFSIAIFVGFMVKSLI